MQTLDGATIDRRRQVIHHRVEQGLNALVLEGRAAHDRMEGALLDRLANQFDELLFGRLFAVEIRRHGVIVELDAGLDQPGAVFSCLILQIGGDLVVAELRAERSLLPR